jgi:DNA-3-methyladenine glycosylase I
MRDYHDTDWGVSEYDPRTLWETLMLEGFQAGLSWEIVLRKREAFREAFLGLDPKKVAMFGADDVERVMTNPDIIRAPSVPRSR